MNVLPALAVPAPVVMGLGAQVAGIATKIKNDVVYSIEDDLDETYDGIHAMCGREFHAALWDQKEVRETFLADNQGYQLRDGAPDVFRVGGVTWERYRKGMGEVVADIEARSTAVSVALIAAKSG